MAEAEQGHDGAVLDVFLGSRLAAAATVPVALVPSRGPRSARSVALARGRDQHQHQVPVALLERYSLFLELLVLGVLTKELISQWSKI